MEERADDLADEVVEKTIVGDMTVEKLGRCEHGLCGGVVFETALLVCC